MEQRMDRKMEEMQRLMALQQNAVVAPPNPSRMNDPGQGLALRSREDLTPSASCESSLSTSSSVSRGLHCESSSSASLQRKHSMDDTALLMAANPTGARNKSQGRTPR